MNENTRPPTEEEAAKFAADVDIVTEVIKSVQLNSEDGACEYNYTASVIVTAVFKLSDSNLKALFHYFMHMKEGIDDVSMKLLTRVFTDAELHDRRN